MKTPLFVKRALSHFASPLPVSLPQYNTFIDDIIELSGQYADRTSMEFAISSILIHADSKHGSLPKKYFVDRLRKSAANQVASQVFQDIKNAQQKAVEAQKTAELAKQAEVTATSTEAVTESVKN